MAPELRVCPEWRGEGGRTPSRWKIGFSRRLLRLVPPRAVYEKEYAMDRAFALLAGAGLGAGLMYILDPDLGRRRRALVRDKAVRLANKAQDAACVVSRDMQNRARGLASGDLSVLAGRKRP